MTRTLGGTDDSTVISGDLMVIFSVLGGARLTGGDSKRLEGLLAQPKRVALLAYLILARPRGFHSRDTLLALFWPELDTQHARWALNQAVHYLREVLGNRGVLRRGDDVAVDAGAINCDAIALENAAAAGRWADAMRCYAGDLLPGVRPGGSAELEQWLDEERRRLQRLTAEVARNRTEELEADGDLTRAADATRVALRLEPDDERHLTKLMELLGSAGDRAGAVRAFQEHAAWLKAERDLAPSSEALDLLKTVQSESTPLTQRTSPSRVSKRQSRWVVTTSVAVIVIVAGLTFAIESTTRGIAASDLQQLTDDPGIEYQPAISPDGRELAYVAGPVSSSHIVIRSSDNAGAAGTVRVNDELISRDFRREFPAWSGDGEHLRFRACGPVCRWYETGRLGGGIRLASLPSHVSRDAFPYVGWSADGTRLAYNVAESVFVSSGRDTSTPRRVSVQPVVYPLQSLAWSPNGSLIAYVHGNPGWASIGNLGASDIWIVSTKGGEPRRVTSGNHLNVSPAWLDDRHLLFVSDEDGARAAYVVEVTADGPHGRPQPIPGITNPHSLSYAINAHRLAWANYTQRENIWSYPLVTTHSLSIRDGVPVTKQNQIIELLDISPDGRRLAFDSHRRGNQDLFVAALPAADAVPLTDAPWDEWNPRWSPDGSQIAFYADREGRGVSSSLMVISAGGGAATALTTAAGFNDSPAWSPDGLHIAFKSSRSEGRREVWLLSRDSVAGSWHHEVLLNREYAQVHDWAPDGRGALVSGRRGIALLSIRGTVLWNRDWGVLGFVGALWARFSRDGTTIYLVGRHQDGRRGVWQIPVASGAARLMIAADDPALMFLGGIAVGRDRLYLTVTETESDIWTARLNW